MCLHESAVPVQQQYKYHNCSSCCHPAGESLVPRAEELLGGLDSSQLAEESAAAVAKAQTLASEAALSESITKLELGADTGAVLAQVQEYLKVGVRCLAVCMCACWRL